MKTLRPHLILAVIVALTAMLPATAKGGTTLVTTIFQRATDPVLLERATSSLENGDAGNINDYWNTVVDYKNQSPRTIIATEFKITIDNAFDETLDQFAVVDNDSFAPGEDRRSTWQHVSTVAAGATARVELARVTFADGTVWTAPQDASTTVPAATAPSEARPTPAPGPPPAQSPTMTLPAPPPPPASGGPALPNQTLPPAGWTTFTHPAFGYSISYPPGWTTTQLSDPSANLELAAPDGRMGIFVSQMGGLPPGLAADTFADVTQAALKQQVGTSFQLLRTEHTLVGQTPAVLMYFEATTPNGVRLYLVTQVMVVGTHAYFVLAAAGADDPTLQTDVALLLRIARSLKPGPD